MTKGEREAVIAHHEAGHAVIARKLGLDVTLVTMSLVEDSFAYYSQYMTEFARDDNLATQLVANETDAIVALAGPLAECRYRRPTTREMATWGLDREAVIRFATYAVRLKHGALTPDLYEELFDRLCNRAWALVNEHWSAIERVAYALREFTILNGAYVDDLIAGKEPRLD